MYPAVLQFTAHLDVAFLNNSYKGREISQYIIRVVQT